MSQDTVVYEEGDSGFFVGLSITTSREYVIIGSGDHVTSEVRLIPASDPRSAAILVSPRRTGHEYSVDHQGERFVVRTNDTHKNSRLATAPADDPREESWTVLVGASDSHYIRAFKSFQDFIAVEERIEGLDHVRLIDRAGNSTYVSFPESAYTVNLDTNLEFQADTLRLEYSSMVTPTTVYDYHLDTDELEVRKVQQVPSGIRLIGVRYRKGNGDRTRRRADSRVHGSPQGDSSGRHRAVVSLRLWRIRVRHSTIIFDHPLVAVGQGFHFRHRPHSRR